jgi:hypothetical protein
VAQDLVIPEQLLRQEGLPAPAALMHRDRGTNSYPTIIQQTTGNIYQIIKNIILQFNRHSKAITVHLGEITFDPDFVLSSNYNYKPKLLFKIDSCRLPPDATFSRGPRGPRRGRS